MKKMLMLLAAAMVVATVAGCGSLRTPKTGANSRNVWYNTFFGLSIESALYGDGVVVGVK